MLAVLVGIGAGFGAIAFRYMIQGGTRAFTGFLDYAGQGRVANPYLPWLGPRFVLLYGVGYPVLGEAVAGGYGIAFLGALLVGKLVACLFAPSLFCGAMLGSAFGETGHAIAPTAGGSVDPYARIGAVFAGAAREPITAVVILVELTGEYWIVLTLMPSSGLPPVSARWCRVTPSTPASGCVVGSTSTSPPTR